MLKKLIFCALVFCCPAAAFAQTAYDALRFSEQHTEGTARSAAMGNAFTALGGDMGGIPINPAASAVYRYSEFQITPSATGTTNSANYLGNTASENTTRFGVSSFGYVGSYDTGRRHTGLINWSFGILLTKQNNFNTSMKAHGRTNTTSWLGALAANTNGVYAPDMDINNTYDPFLYGNASWNSILGWNTTLLDTLPGTSDQYIGATENLDGYDISIGGDLDQMFRSTSRGNITEATFNFGGNISNKLFFGVNIGIHSISYSYEEKYSEDAVNSNDFQTGFEHFSTAYRYKATGSGVNLKAGLIYLPSDWLRLGASISTPTWMHVNEDWENSMDARFNDGYSQSLLSPLGTYNYMLNTPFRWSIGAALKLGTTGVLSVDYESADYSNAKLHSSGYYSMSDFSDANDEIERTLGIQKIFRAGAEVNATPAFALRAGYQYWSSPYSDNKSDDAKNIGSLGIGYSVPWGASDFFVDLTYQQLLKKSKEQFALYADTDLPAPTGTNSISNWKVLLSLGFRF